MVGLRGQSIGMTVSLEAAFARDGLAGVALADAACAALRKLVIQSTPGWNFAPET